MKRYLKIGVLCYALFAALLLGGRWLSSFNSAGWLTSAPISTLVVVMFSILFPLAMLGPAVVTTLIIRRIWPQQDWSTVLKAWIPATVASGAVTPLFWMIISSAGVSWSDVVSLPVSTYVVTAMVWLVGTFLVLSLDHWVHSSKNLPSRQ